MTTESTAASSHDSKKCKSVDPETVMHRMGTGGAPATRSAVSLEALAGAILENLKLLLLGPMIVGLIAFGIATVLPKWYTSIAYLSLDETGARTADALMRSAPVLDKVLAEFNAPRDTLEARRRFIEGNRRIVVTPGDIQHTSKLFLMEYSDRDPHVAQKVNSLFIEAWLESTKPPPEKRKVIEAEIVRMDFQAKSSSELVDRLQKDSASLTTQSRPGEYATLIMNLIEKRDQSLESLIALRNSLNGLPRDVVFAAPGLPEAPSWPKKGIITILAGFITGLLLLMFVILRHFRSFSI